MDFVSLNVSLQCSLARIGMVVELSKRKHYTRTSAVAQINKSAGRGAWSDLYMKKTSRNDAILSTYYNCAAGGKMAVCVCEGVCVNINAGKINTPRGERVPGDQCRWPESPARGAI